MEKWRKSQGQAFTGRVRWCECRAALVIQAGAPATSQRSCRPPRAKVTGGEPNQVGSIAFDDTSEQPYLRVMPLVHLPLSGNELRRIFWRSCACTMSPWVLMKAARPNAIWVLDFVPDALASGQGFRIFSVEDQLTRRSLAAGLAMDLALIWMQVAVVSASRL